MPMVKDFHILPTLRDSVSYVYSEHVVISQKNHALEFWDKEGCTHLPIAELSVLLLGPGTSISHAAVKALAEHGCSLLWVGEDGMRCYAQGTGETRKAYRLARQAALVSSPESRLNIVRQMYALRFGQPFDNSLSIQQIRGMEGARVRQVYQTASRTYGVPWQGRNYKHTDWHQADPINRALSAANALLNGLCHSAIVAGGYSPALGFIHTGKQLSFVYDIADLYKAEITIPLAFQIVAESKTNVERRVRQACRERFREKKLLGRILPDIDRLLQLPENDDDLTPDFDQTDDPSGGWWGPDGNVYPWEELSDGGHTA